MSVNIKGYPLKKYLLKKWIYKNGYTQPYVAGKLGLSAEEFKRKLRERDKFNREELRRLIDLMKAEEAFKVIYFPTLAMRESVRIKVFGNRRGEK